jgi:geranylgeranyl reductase family protein
MHDVLVVGGGPGGLHAAALLARQGFEVLVAEEHRVTGEPVHCTGVLAAAAFDEFDLPAESILNTLKTAHFHSPAGYAIDHATPTTEAVVIDRMVFDRGLHQRAQAAGAAISVGTRVIDIETRPSCVSVRCADGAERRARVAVLACGASYALQLKLGLGKPAVFLSSAQMELPATRSGDVEVYFGNEVAPKGFAWVVPVRRGENECVRIGLMCDRDAARHFDAFARSVGPRWGIRWPEVNDQAGPRQKMLPLAPIRSTYTDRVIAVGDAAGLVKATTGGGIYYSLVSAAIAADVLADSLRRDALGAGDLKTYEKEWRRRLGSELRAQLALRMLVQHLGDREIEALFELARTNGVMPIVRRTARFNEHRDLIVSLFKHPPARRLLFRQLAARTAALSLQ